MPLCIRREAGREREGKTQFNHFFLWRECCLGGWRRLEESLVIL